MARQLILAIAGLLSVGVGATAAFAQDNILDQLYGKGVHAFYSRDFVTAHRLLTSAIDQGTRDPRAYYFRGFTYEMTGRPEQAEADF